MRPLAVLGLYNRVDEPLSSRSKGSWLHTDGGRIGYSLCSGSTTSWRESCSRLYVIYVRGLMRLLAVRGPYDLLRMSCAGAQLIPNLMKDELLWLLREVRGLMWLLAVLGLYDLDG